MRRPNLLETTSPTDYALHVSLCLLKPTDPIARRTGKMLFALLETHLAAAPALILQALPLVVAPTSTTFTLVLAWTSEVVAG